MSNAYQSKYFAHDLQRRSAKDDKRLATALCDAAVDLNPHRIQAALFAVRSPFGKGVLLVDRRPSGCADLQTDTAGGGLW